MDLEIIFRFEVIAVILQFSLILVLLFLNLNEFKRQIERIKNKVWLMLFFILIFGLVLRLEYVYVHTIPLGDELLQTEEAKNIKLSFQKIPCYLNSVYSSTHRDTLESVPKCELRQPYPLSYSFFVFVFSFFFGSFEEGAFFVSFVFGLLGIFLMFFLAYFLFKEEVVALFAALFFSFFPSFVEFSCTPNNFMTSVFFIELSAVLMLLAISSNTWKSWFLAGLVLVFTLMVRVENLLVVVLFIFFVLVHKKEKKRILLSFLTAFLFYIPTFLFLVHPLTTGYAAAHGQPPLSYILSLHDIRYNIYFNLKYSAHFSLWILGLIGFYYLFKGRRIYFYFLGSWFFVVFLFYVLFNDMINFYCLDRYIFSYIPFVIVTAAGFSYIIKITDHIPHRKLKLIILFLLFVLILYSNVTFLIHYPGRDGFNEEHQYLQLEDFETIQIDGFGIGPGIEFGNFGLLNNRTNVFDYQSYLRFL